MLNWCRLLVVLTEGSDSCLFQEQGDLYLKLVRSGYKVSFFIDVYCLLVRISRNAIMHYERMSIKVMTLVNERLSWKVLSSAST